MLIILRGVSWGTFFFYRTFFRLPLVLRLPFSQDSCGLIIIGNAPSRPPTEPAPHRNPHQNTAVNITSIPSMRPSLLGLSCVPRICTLTSSATKWQGPETQRGCKEPLGPQACA